MRQVSKILLTSTFVSALFFLSTHVRASASSQEASGPATSSASSFTCPAINPDHPLIALLRKGTLPREYTFVLDAVTWSVTSHSGLMSVAGLEPSGRNPQLSDKDLTGENFNKKIPECSYYFSADAFQGTTQVGMHDFSFVLMPTNDYRKIKITPSRIKSSQGAPSVDTAKVMNLLNKISDKYPAADFAYAFKTFLEERRAKGPTR